MRTTYAAFSIGDSVQQSFDKFFAFLPNLIGALVILLVGYIVAKVVKAVVVKVLGTVGLDRTLHGNQAGQYVEKVSPGAKPSKLIGAVAFWFIFLGAVSLAVSALQIPALTTFIASIYGYLPNVVAAILIFLVAAAVSGAASGLVAKTMGDTPTGKIVATVVPIVILGIAGFMILDQLKIAPQIVAITYTALIGALALGLALAFGLGGRNVAAQLLDSAYQTGQEQKGQVKADLRTGRDRAQDLGEQAKDRAKEAHARQDQTGQAAGEGAYRPAS